MINYADIVIGLSYGDEGKGKVTNSFLKRGRYSHCIRFNGGHNAGHTIMKGNKKIVTHVVPTGVVQGVKSIIGPGCVVSPRLLSEEIEDLKKNGLEIKGNLFIDKRVNFVTSQHLAEDETDDKIGTTKRGNGPAYRDKYARKNMRFGDFKHWDREEFELIDIYEELHETETESTILMEGAQAFGLDIDWGDYPYVTSSHCGVAGALQNGIPASKLRNVYGVCKAYDTYVGSKKFEDEDPVLSKIREVGNEFGATTGRPRQVGYLDLDLLVKSARINGVTHLIVNKFDILKELDVWRVKEDGKVKELSTPATFTEYVNRTLSKKVSTLRNIVYSSSPNDI